MNNAYSSYFIVIYDQLLHFWGINCLLTECSQNQVYLLCGGMSECSSVVEHSTVDREVGGTIPLAPFCIIMVTYQKTFDVRI